MQGVALAREVLEELAAGEEPTDIPALVEKVATNISTADPSQPLSSQAKDLAVAHVEIKIGRRKFKLKPGRKRRGSGLPGSSSAKRPRGGKSGMGKSMSRSRLGMGSEVGEDGGGYFFGDEFDNVSDDDIPDDFQISDLDEEDNNKIDPYEGPGKARRRAWRRIKYWKRRAEEEQRQKAAEEATLDNERKANVARGSPPALEVSSRLPLKCLPDLLMIWEFSQAFGDVLQLPPFSLTALEAALDPGPRIRKVETGNTAKRKETGPKEAKEAAVTTTKGKEGVKIEEEAKNEENASPAVVTAVPSPDNPVATALSMAQARQDAYIATLGKYGLTPEALMSMIPLDRDSASAGLLLRDLVSSLASAAAGLLPGLVASAAGQPQPRTAKLSNPDAEHPTWPERLANTVWGASSSPPAAREAALKLAYGDYLDLTSEERLGLLVALTHAALSSEAMMAEISLRVDQFGVTTVRRDGAAGDELEDENGRLAAAAAAAVMVPRAPPPPPPPAPGVEAPPTPPTPPPPSPLELWKRWLTAQNLGIRRPLGVDFLGRRYWALGRQAGAFRIYCEDPQGDTWGWYEGEAIQSLISWFAAATIRCETSLALALRAAPLPYSNPTPSAPARRMAGHELVNLRSDGYKGLTLPLLKGEWNSRKEGVERGQPPPPMEQRIPLAIDVLLGSVPSWFKVRITEKRSY